MKTKTLTATQWLHPYFWKYSVSYKGETDHGPNGMGYTITEAKEYAKRHGYTHIKIERESGTARRKV